MADYSGNGHCLRILYLEDDPSDSEFVQAELVQHQVTCQMKRVSTRTAFEQELRNGELDAIVSDSKGPGFNTQEALALARAERPRTPFIVVSGNSSAEAKETALRQGAAFFVAKRSLSELTQVLLRIRTEAARGTWGKRLPGVGQPVMVQCRGFRCLGYLDGKGKWREFARSDELREVLSWSEV